MEECDGGQYSSETTGYGNIQNLINNKNSGGRRTNPQQNSEQRMAKFFKCGNCEFISQCTHDKTTHRPTEWGK